MSSLLRVLGVAALAAAGLSHGQSYPTKPVRLVAGFPAGGGVDATARAYAQKLGEYWGQNVIVENRSGANGMVGAEAVVRSPKDGHTLFLSTPAEVALNVLLYAKIPYDPLKDLAPISLVAVYPNVMVVNASVPASTVAEIIALARRTPGGLHYGSSGTGSTQHLAGEWLQRYAGFNWVHVPYKGAAPATTDILGGQIPVAILGLGAIMPHIKSGRLRAIATTSIQRGAALPDVPTLHESGIKFDATQWYGILTAAGAPADVVARIHADLKRASAEPSVTERLAALGGEAATSTPEEYAALIRSETEKFAKIVRDANIKAD